MKNLSRKGRLESEGDDLPPRPPGKKVLSKKAKAKARAAKPLDEVEKESLEDLLERLEIDDWDLLIVGDGSGSNYDHECGWASVSIERLTMERMVWCGAMNLGTVNVAEIMAYVQPLNWLDAREEDRRQKKKVRRNSYKVHIVTDSQYCRNTGSSGSKVLKKNSVLWAAMDCFARKGFVLTWHWIDRETAGLNLYADKLSKLARTLMKKGGLQAKMEQDETGDVVKTVYDVNPSAE